MMLLKGWRDGTTYYLATDRHECVSAFARFVDRWEYVNPTQEVTMKQ